MASSARVLLFDSPRRYGDLAAKLEARGYASLVAHDIEDARNLVLEAHPDIAIVAGGDGADRNAIPNALAGARSSPPLPLIVIESEPVDEDVSRDGADAMTEFLAEPFNDVQLFSRLHSLSRLVTMQQELARRGETARRCGIEAPVEVAPPEKVTGAKILILAGPELSVAESHAVLGKEAVLAVVEEAHVALSRLEDGTFDAVLVYASGPDSEWLDLCRRLRQNTRLYNLPALVIAGPAIYRDVEPIYEAGASDVLRGDTPVDEIAFRMFSLVRMQRYRLAMQKVYREIRDERTSDSLTGLYNREFLLAHLAAEIRDATRGDKSLGLGYLEISDLDRVEESLGEAAGRRIVRQIGGLIGALVRGEDLPARCAEDGICVVLPNTDESAARRVLRRLAAIVNVTTLEIPDLEAPIGVHVRSGCASSVADETAEALIERARADLSD